MTTFLKFVWVIRSKNMQMIQNYLIYASFFFLRSNTNTEFVSNKSFDAFTRFFGKIGLLIKEMKSVIVMTLTPLMTYARSHQKALLSIKPL